MSALKQGLGAVFAAASVLAVSPAVLAQPYPSKPIRVIVNSAPAGLTDVIARLVTPRMSQSMGQPMVVENRTGAGGLTGAEFVAKAEPDGYTIGVVASAITVAPQLVATAPFDASKDFAPVALLMSTPLILVTGINSPYHSVAQAQTRREVIARLNDAANEALNVPEIRERILNLGGTVEGGSPSVLADLIRSEMPRWGKLIRERGIKMQ